MNNVAVGKGYRGWVAPSVRLHGMSSLHAQRRALEVTGQNIALPTPTTTAASGWVCRPGAPVMPAVYAQGDPAGARSVS